MNDLLISTVFVCIGLISFLTYGLTIAEPDRCGWTIGKSYLFLPWEKWNLQT